MAENWDQHRIPVTHDGAGPSRLNPDFSNNFYEGLRVLIYAQNQVNLCNYATCLESNDYKVSMTFSEEEAMNQLCKHRNTFDIALIEVHKPEGSIFQSISQIGKQINCPIIVISKDASKSSVKQWLINGAWDCLIDPISKNDLKYLFKHVVTMRARRSMVAGEKAAGEKSFSLGPNYNGDHSSKASTSKKKRCVWDSTLHEKFIDAVNHFGIDNANPKKIVEYMNDPNLTRDNVASHLQKYRQKEKEKKKNSLSISEAKTKNVGEQEEATELKRKTNVESETYHINNILQPFLEQQNIINSNDLMPYPIPSSFRHHHGEVSVARLMPHQPISEQQNIINPNILMSHPIPSSFKPHHDEVFVDRLMNHQQYETTNFTQPNNSGGTNIWFKNMNNEMGFANGGSLNGHETEPQLYTTNVNGFNLMDSETEPQLYTCNVDGCNVKDPETDSECTNNSTYPVQNNN